MTKVTIDPGVCGNIATASAASEDGMSVTVDVQTNCPFVKKMFETLGNEFDGYELCLAKPGEGPLYGHAAEHFKGHAACPTISGVLKAVEAECQLALPRDVSIKFE